MSSFRKIFAIIFLISLFAFQPVSFVIAENGNDTTTAPTTTSTTSGDTQALSQDLDVTLSYGVQDSPSKEFDLIATITSNIDSDRVIVEWTTPIAFAFTDQYQFSIQQTTVAKGETKVLRARVKPDQGGINKVEVKITAVKADVNYISSDSKEITLNDSKEIIPLSKEYKKDKLINQVINAIAIILVLAAVLGAGVWVFGRYRQATSKK